MVTAGSTPEGQAVGHLLQELAQLQVSDLPPEWAMAGQLIPLVAQATPQIVAAVDASPRAQRLAREILMPVVELLAP